MYGFSISYTKKKQNQKSKRFHLNQILHHQKQAQKMPFLNILNNLENKTKQINVSRFQLFVIMPMQFYF